MLSDVTQKHLRTGDLLSHLEIEIAVRPPLLRDNLRNTREICQMGQNLLDGSRFEEIDGSGPSQAVQPEVSKKGFEPTLIFHETEEQEILWLVELITELTSESHGYQHGDIALIARTNRTLTFLELNLEQAQIPAQYFKKSGHDRTSNKVKICSYLDCKGMDFPVVILLEGVDQILPTVPTSIDSDEMSAHLTREKALLYCGMCRAKEMLYISGAEGEPSRFLAPLMEALEAKPEASTEDEPAEESALAEENA